MIVYMNTNYLGVVETPLSFSHEDTFAGRENSFAACSFTCGLSAVNPALPERETLVRRDGGAESGRVSRQTEPWKDG